MAAISVPQNGNNLPVDVEGCFQRNTSESSVYLSSENIAPSSDEKADNPSFVPDHLNNELPKQHNKNCHIIIEDDAVDMVLMDDMAAKMKGGSNLLAGADPNAVKDCSFETTSITSIESAVFFNDGKRRIDFILVHSLSPSDVEEGHSIARAIFEENLRDEGLELEYSNQEEMELMFLKIHAPWDVLSRYGEILKFKMPMKESLFETSETHRMKCVGSATWQSFLTMCYD